jgi:5-methylcytosine-specific restriction endonuclease McrA
MAKPKYIPLAERSPEAQELLRAYNRAWRAKNKAHVQAYGHERYVENKAADPVAFNEAGNARSRKSYHANLEASREKNRVKRRRLYAANPGPSLVSSARWKTRNKARHIAYNTAWLREHPEVAREQKAKHHARKKHAPVNDFTAKQWRALCKAMGYCCAYCGKKFPFKDLTQDHITPLAKGGSHTLSNIIPACKSCNSRKWSGDVPTPVQPFLLVEDAAAD